MVWEIVVLQPPNKLIAVWGFKHFKIMHTWIQEYTFIAHKTWVIGSYYTGTIVSYCKHLLIMVKLLNILNLELTNSQLFTDKSC